MTSTLLSAGEVAARLATLPGWRVAEARLVRTVTTRDFRSALELLTRVADVADEQNHHPDAAIHWNELTLSVWTHSAGGIMSRDFRLAEAIEPLLSTGTG